MLVRNDPWIARGRPEADRGHPRPSYSKGAAASGRGRRSFESVAPGTVNVHTEEVNTDSYLTPHTRST